MKAVFFDAGHTLIHAHPDIGTVYSETTARLGATVPPERFVEAFQPVFKAIVREYAAQGEASDEQDYRMWRAITSRIHSRIEELHAIDFDTWFEALYQRFGETEVWRPYEDVERGLGALRDQGLRLGIVSNWDTRLRRICTGLGLDRWVDFIVISAEVGVRKPDPRIFRAALEKAGVSAAEAAHVGDLPEEDVAGARAAGIEPFLIDRRKRLTDGRPVEGVRTIRTLDELAGILA